MDAQTSASHSNPAPLGMNRRRLVQGLSAGLAAGCLGRVSADENSDQHPLVPAIRIARECAGHISALPGYSCIFAKKEVVDNHLIEQKMRLKIRHKPFSVYMYFEEPKAGREVIFVEGRNDNRLQVHETGLASLIGTLSLAPEDPRVKAENRHPITKAGILRTIEAQIAIWESELKYGEVSVKYLQDAKIGDLSCRVVESSHPEPRRQFAFQKTRLWIDVKSGYPVRLQQFAFPKKPDVPAPIVEDYTFTQINADVEFTDRDFDVANPDYNF
ncbi:MAG: DUF1571 domain-containing protein [Planctomycetaceae bacterium]